MRPEPSSKIPSNEQVGSDRLFSFLVEAQEALCREIDEGKTECRKISDAREIVGSILDHELEVRKMKVITQQRALVTLNHLQFLANRLKDNETQNSERES